MTRDEEETARKFASMITELGGESCPLASITSTLELPSGKVLVDWLLDQLDFSDLPSSEVLAKDATGERARLHPALSAIALHEQEVKLANICAESDFSVDDEDMRISSPANYSTPPKLESCLTRTKAESELIDKEARMLKARIEQLRTASRTIGQTIKNLHEHVKELDRQIASKQENISELSIESRVTLKNCTDSAEQLLSSLDLNSKTAQSSAAQSFLNNYQRQLDDLDDFRSQIAMYMEEGVAQIDKARNSIPCVEDVKKEAARLQEAYDTLRRVERLNKSNATSLLLSAELTKLSEDLESGHDSGAGPEELSHILSEESNRENMKNYDLGAGIFDVDVKSEIEQAWTLDQEALIDAQVRLLEKVRSYMKEHLTPPLERLHRNLSASATLINDTEAMVSALVQELEEAANDVMSAQQSSCGKSLSICSIGREADKLLETQMVEILKREHSSYGSRLVMLSRDDLPNALASVQDTLAAARHAEEGWSTELKQRLVGLSESYAPLISVIYSHSPVNTSPPFIPPEEQGSIELKARAQSDVLTKATARLQKETELGRREEKKLNAFVDKWTAGFGR